MEPRSLHVKNIRIADLLYSFDELFANLMGTIKVWIMTAPRRFDIAIDKLYNAFHAGTLNPECCKNCAVWNICDNTDAWKNLTDTHGSTKLNYVGIVIRKLWPENQ